MKFVTVFVAFAAVAAQDLEETGNNQGNCLQVLTGKGRFEVTPEALKVKALPVQIFCQNAAGEPESFAPTLCLGKECLAKGLVKNLGDRALNKEVIHVTPECQLLRIQPLVENGATITMGNKTRVRITRKNKEGHEVEVRRRTLGVGGSDNELLTPVKTREVKNTIREAFQIDQSANLITLQAPGGTDYMILGLRICPE